MSESAPRTNSRLENFDANKAEFEAQQAARDRERFEDAVYGEAGKSDFSDEARRRVEEADSYEQHLEKMTQRGDDYDQFSNPESHQAYGREVEEAYAENEARDAATEAHRQEIEDMIAADPKLRRMDMMARDIAKISATEVTPENADRLPGVLEDKQEKLLELLGEFDADESLTREQRTDIINRISALADGEGLQISDSEVTPEEDSEDDNEGESADEETPSDDSEEKTAKDTEDNDEKPAEDEEAGEEKPLGIAPEPIAAKENESLEEYEARHGVKPGKELELWQEPNLMGNEHIAKGYEEAEIKAFAEDEMSRFEEHKRTVGNNFMVNLWGTGNRLSEKTREKLSGKKRLKWVLGGLALAGVATAAWLNRDGLSDGLHDLFTNGNGNGGSSSGSAEAGLGPKLDKVPGPDAAGDLVGQSFSVESGHGYTHELVDFAKANGHDLSPQQSLDLHNHLVDKFGPDYIQGVGHYTDGNELRLSGTGTASFENGVAAEIKNTLNW